MEHLDQNVRLSTNPSGQFGRSAKLQINQKLVRRRTQGADRKRAPADR